eukprot:TRINITY_DN18742_c0_g1_i2.p1 TRINITY_DN18742_c0_g1~~TRINITY_DN18742_c0_g1_i2.p1  ORF type:complete len:236 (+),score=16.79 TRINITY_DN18742_c0_g1_i2:148-855(+)
MALVPRRRRGRSPVSCDGGARTTAPRARPSARVCAPSPRSVSELLTAAWAGAPQVGGQLREPPPAPGGLARRPPEWLRARAPLASSVIAGQSSGTEGLARDWMERHTNLECVKEFVHSPGNVRPRGLAPTLIFILYVTIQDYTYQFVADRVCTRCPRVHHFFNRFILTYIMLNTLVLALEHHGEPFAAGAGGFRKSGSNKSKITGTVTFPSGHESLPLRLPSAPRPATPSRARGG